MKFDILTIFPNIFDSYFNESIIKRAQEKKIVQIHIRNLRDFARDARKTVDDKPYGGGAGMVLMAEPILKAVAYIAKKKNPRRKIVVFSAKGKPFNQKLAYRWAKKYDQIVIISGRYEGIDERVKTVLKAEEISIGPYVLTDGEVPAMAVVSAVTRLLPDVIASESLVEESFSTHLQTTNYKLQTNKEYPHYTRPEILKSAKKSFRVPGVLLSGDHKKIAEWRRKRMK